MLSILFFFTQGAKKVIFTACHSGKLKLTFTSPNIISTSPKNGLMSRLISHFFCNLNSSKKLLSLHAVTVKQQRYFVSSSYMFLDKKSLLKIWHNPGLNLTIFRGTEPSSKILNCNIWVKAKTMLLQQCHPGLKLHKIYNGNNIINNNIILVSTIFQCSSIILNIILYWELRVTFIILPVCQTKCYLKLEILTG